MALFRFIVLIFIVNGIFIACDSRQQVDLIIQNAKIYTVDNNFNVVQGAAIVNGKFVAVGPDATIKARYSSEVTLNLRGKFVFPGFIDAHSHFTYFAETLNQVDLTTTKTYQEVIGALKQHQAENADGWLVGFGWDQNNWPDKKMPDNQQLNQNFPDVPVFIWRVDGHAALLNAKALNVMGIDEKAQNKLIEIKNGKPTGLIFEEKAVELFEKIDKPDALKMSKLMAQAQFKCFSKGLTGVTDAGLSRAEVKFIDSLQLAGELDIPIFVMLDPTTENIGEYIQNGPVYSDKLHIGAIKVYIDGALGSRGALLLEPYTDEPNRSGILRISPDSLLTICRLAYENNYQVCGHAIGDSACRILLNAYNSVLPAGNNQRWRVEHAQVVNPVDLKTFARLGIIPSVQTSHFFSDKDWAIDRLGNERMKHAYAWQDLLRQNGWLANGSDFPVERVDPLWNFYTAIARIDSPPVPKKQEQNLTRVQALKAMTIWAAMAQFEETSNGSIEPGKWANFLVLDKNIMAIHHSEILKTNVEQTWCHGKLVYQSDTTSNQN